jgi:hypothetical protein
MASSTPAIAISAFPDHRGLRGAPLGVLGPIGFDGIPVAFGFGNDAVACGEEMEWVTKDKRIGMTSEARSGEKVAAVIASCSAAASWLRCGQGPAGDGVLLGSFAGTSWMPLLRHGMVL